LQLLAIVVAGRVLDLVADLLDSAVDVSPTAGAADPRLPISASPMTILHGISGYRPKPSRDCVARWESCAGQQSVPRRPAQPARRSVLRHEDRYLALHHRILELDD